MKAVIFKRPLYDDINHVLCVTFLVNVNSRHLFFVNTSMTTSSKAELVFRLKGEIFEGFSMDKVDRAKSR